MTRKMSVAAVALAAACFAAGFFVADRMESARAAAPSPVQDGFGFSGTDGVVVVKSQLVVIRGGKYYRIDPFGPGGPQRAHGTIAE